jgi:hypothetical protein
MASCEEANLFHGGLDSDQLPRARKHSQSGKIAGMASCEEATSSTQVWLMITYLGTTPRVSGCWDGQM